MSKIEEALEKANKLRETTSVRDGEVNARRTKPENIKKVSPRVINNRDLITIVDPESPIVEEYRKLKSMVLRETKADFLNTIMITSAMDNEGKTLTAINLAVTLAQEIDHSILLVDSDLRQPTMHQYLGVDCKLGLSDYLTSDIDLSEILVKTGIGNLVLLPAGRPVNNPVELLSSKKMEALIKEIKQRYMDRYVIIDTPPIVAFAEGMALGSFVDGIVFVIQEGRAPVKTIEDALNMIKDFNILGVVYNNVSEVQHEGHSHYYYKYQAKE